MEERKNDPNPLFSSSPEKETSLRKSPSYNQVTSPGGRISEEAQRKVNMTTNEAAEVTALNTTPL